LQCSMSAYFSHSSAHRSQISVGDGLLPFTCNVKSGALEGGLSPLSAKPAELSTCLITIKWAVLAGGVVSGPGGP
jgi:hypothetical protein